MHTIQLNKKYYIISSSWDTLTGKQLVQIMKVLQAEAVGLAERVHLLKILCGISWWHWLFIPADEIQDALYLTDWLLQENNLTKNLLPKYKGFYGPGDDFTNLIVSEYAYSEPLFLMWDADKDNMDLLNEFVATLYRPCKPDYDHAKNEDGDARIGHNENLCAYYAKNEIVYWPEAVKRAIAHWYAGCRQKLVADFADVFNGDGEPAKYGFLEVMTDVAESGAFGDFEKVEKMTVRLLMVQMDKKVRQAKEMERQMSK